MVKRFVLYVLCLLALTLASMADLGLPWRP